jgi:hypothetical protein
MPVTSTGMTMEGEETPGENKPDSRGSSPRMTMGGGVLYPLLIGKRTGGRGVEPPRGSGWNPALFKGVDARHKAGHDDGGVDAAAVSGISGWFCP